MSVSVLARWQRRQVRVQVRVYVALSVLVALAIAATVVVSMMSKAIIPSGRSDFGSAPFAYGPLSSVGASAAKESAEKLGIRIGFMCDVDATVSGVAAPIRLRSFAATDSIAASSIVTSRLETLRTDEVLASPKLLTLLGGRTDITINGRFTHITGQAKNPDALNDTFLVSNQLANVDEADSRCSVLLSESSGTTAASLSVAALHHESEAPAIIRSRSEEASSGALKPLLWVVQILLVCLIAVLCSAGFASTSERVQNEVAILLSVGASRKRIRNALFGLGFGVGVFGVIIGLAFGIGISVVLVSRVAHALGYAPPSKTLDAFDLIVPSVLAIVVTTSSGIRPAMRLLRNSTSTLIRENEVGWRTRRRSIVVAASGMIAFAAGLFGVVTGRRSESDLGVLFAVLIAFGPLLCASAFVGFPVRLFRKPSTMQLAVRDIARHRKRSIPIVVMGAVSIGVSLSMVFVVHAVIAGSRARPAVLANQIVLTSKSGWFGAQADPLDPVGAVSEAAQLQVRQTVPNTDAVVLWRLANPGHDAIGPGSSAVLEFGRATLRNSNDPSRQTFLSDSLPIYVATPQLQKALGVVLPRDASEEVDFYTGHTWRGKQPSLNLTTDRLKGTTPPFVVHHVSQLKTDVAPAVLISEKDAERWGRTFDAGILFSSRSDLTRSEVAAAEKVINANGLLASTPPGHANEVVLSKAATVVAVILGLGTALLAAALIAAASRKDVFSLFAVGVGPRRLARLDAQRTFMLGVLSLLLCFPIAFAPLLAAQVSLTPPTLVPPVLPLVVVALMTTMIPPLVRLVWFRRMISRASASL